MFSAEWKCLYMNKELGPLTHLFATEHNHTIFVSKNTP